MRALNSPALNSPALNSIAFRLVATAAVWIAVALVAGGFLLANLFREPLEQAFEQRLRFILQSLVSDTEIGASGDITDPTSVSEPRFLSQYSGLYWQIGNATDNRILSRSRSMWDYELPVSPPPAKALTENHYSIDGPLGQKLRVLELFVTEEDVTSTFVFAVAADIEEFLVAVDTFNRTLVLSLGALGLGLLIAVIAQVYFGLLPLQRIRSALADVREGRAERLEGRFPTEVEPLAAELNGLVIHTTEVLARARAHVGNLAHGLKTPLAVLANESDNPTVDMPAIVRQQTDLMRRQVEHYLSRTRAIGNVPLPRSHTELLPAMQAMARTLEKIYAASKLGLTVDCEPGLTFRGEQHDLEEMLGNLTDNACKWAHSQVQIAARSQAATGSGGLQIVITVDDDGAGVDPALRPYLFDRGRRADESKPGSGLGLSIVRDISALYGGSSELSDSPLGGLRATLILPGGVAGTA